MPRHTPLSVQREIHVDACARYVIAYVEEAGEGRRPVHSAASEGEAGRETARKGENVRERRERKREGARVTEREHGLM